jgi:hypothetical protein
MPNPRDHNPGVALWKYRSLGADVLLFCRACVYDKVIPLEEVIARLNARGIDGENVGIVDLARFTTHACPKCGARKWETRPAFPSIPGLTGVRAEK